MARTPPPREAPTEPIDDYVVDRDTERVGPPAGARILQGLNALLLAILALLSLALFFVVATLLGIV
jgi:hypothetical protein